jgi:hypothetical protein
LLGLLGLLGLLCCLLSHNNNSTPTLVGPPAIAGPTPDPIKPDVIDPIPIIPPVVPVRPNEMDPVRQDPIGIKDCDLKAINGSIIDPTITQPQGVTPINTIISPH